MPENCRRITLVFLSLGIFNTPKCFGPAPVKIPSPIGIRPDCHIFHESLKTTMIVI